MSRKSTKETSTAFKGLFKSSAGGKLFPRAMAKEQQFEDFLPFAFLLGDDKTVQTKDRQLIQFVRLDGINAASASDDAINAMKNLFAEIVFNAEDQFSYYVHKIAKNIKYEPAPIEGNSFARECDEKWLSYLHEIGHRDVTITISVVSKPSLLNKFNGLVDRFRQLRGDAFADERYEAYQADLRERCSRLSEFTALIESTFARQNARLLKASSGELLGFLESIGCGTETLTFPTDERAVLARAVANYRPTMNGTTLTISGGSVPNRYGRIFTIKNYPRKAFAGMFDEMKLPLDLVITNSFTPISDDKAKELLRRTLAQRASIGDVAETDQAQMREGRDKIASGLESLGYHHMTVAIYADDKETIERASAEIRSVAQEVGAKVITEAFAGMGHYFAQWPGNADFRSRTGLISNFAFASLAALHRTPTGLDAGQLPWGAPITAFPTLDGGLYKFSFHPKGSPDTEPPAGHAAMFGLMGSGKTVAITFLAAQARRQNVRTFLFDYRRGMETAVRALNGTYTTISPEKPTGLNPLYTETDKSGQAWLTDWLIALLDRADKPFTARQRQALSDAVSQNAQAHEHLRNFQNFRELFGHVDDEEELQQRVNEWCAGGRHGWVFGDNEVENFTLDNPVMGFDMTTVLDSKQEKEKTAILGYLFRQIEKKLQDKKPTLIVIDEAWSALNTEYFAGKLQDWLVTVRKLNAVVLLVTQFPSQLTGSQLGSGILQAIRSQIVLPNHSAKAENYLAIDLNHRELHTVLHSPPGSRVALIRNDVDSVTVNIDLSNLGEHLSILGGGPSGIAALEKYISRGSNV
ncbi:TraG/VirB4 family ATPase [Brucella anthropi]|uniref:VirB4 family type IV secretion/conjugal transfer ATPase n=1 Tax=Brucella anthropi TaxID=529 RepID=UPI00215873E0|nr:type IV secretion system protein B4 [Brucella anthropi]MCR8493696.1 type IV secretion system protein B4 [Brucella anthropi]